MASVFPQTVDTFKTIPNPTVTRTDQSDGTTDPLSTRLQQHSDAILALETYLVGRGCTNYGTDSGGVNGYVVSLFSPLTALAVGTLVSFVPLNTNTGASTIQLDALGTWPILTSAGGPLSSGELSDNRTVTMVYDASAFRIISPIHLVKNLGGVSGTQFIECAGYTTVSVTVVFNSASGPAVSLSHLANGVHVFLEIGNSTGGVISVGIQATSPSGVVFTNVVGLKSGSANGSGFINLITTGLALNSNLAFMLHGSAVGPTSLYLAI